MLANLRPNFGPKRTSLAKLHRSCWSWPKSSRVRYLTHTHSHMGRARSTLRRRSSSSESAWARTREPRPVLVRAAPARCGGPASRRVSGRVGGAGPPSATPVARCGPSPHPGLRSVATAPVPPRAAPGEAPAAPSLNRACSGGWGPVPLAPDGRDVTSRSASAGRRRRYGHPRRACSGPPAAAWAPCGVDTAALCF